eukprot:scaffold3162_cov101-Isochrysis_galbana.AAC.11
MLAAVYVYVLRTTSASPSINLASRSSTSSWPTVKECRGAHVSRPREVEGTRPQKRPSKKQGTGGPRCLRRLARRKLNHSRRRNHHAGAKSASRRRLTRFNSAPCQMRGRTVRAI